jgi:hypothetical protein
MLVLTTNIKDWEEILEYCPKAKLLEREQFYLDLLVPDYNILKYAYSLPPRRLAGGGGEGLNIARRV